MTRIRLVLCCPPSWLPIKLQNSVEGLLEVYEDMVPVLLALAIFLAEDSQVEDLLCGAPSCSEACLFFSDDLLCLWPKSVQYDFQHDCSSGTAAGCLSWK